MTSSPATYGLLGLLAVRPWTGYELTHQVQRSLRFTWPTSAGHLYREQRRLVELGWATVEDEPAGRRTRKRYTITPDGRRALEQWQATPPQEPQLHVEGLLRVFFGDHASPDVLAATMWATAGQAGQMLDELHGFVAEYLADSGPLSMLEAGTGGPDGRQDFHGRPMFPERLHVVAVAIDTLTQLLASIQSSFAADAAAVASWPGTTDASLTAQTRARLEQVASRRSPAQPGART